jgi:WD40 repeat protein
MTAKVTGVPSGGGGSGDFVGPSSSTDNAIVRYDGTTGKLAQNSLATVGDTGDLGAVSLASTGGQITAGSSAVQGSIIMWDGAGTNTRTRIIVTAGTNPIRNVQINAAALTGNRTITVLNEDMTPVGLTNTQTLTNKTLTDPVFAGGAKFKGLTTSTAAASTTELPNDKDFSIHKNTDTGVMQFAVNDGGVIKAVLLA